MLQTGQIDMMAAISRTQEREGTMLFSEQPMGEEKYYLYGDLANTDISPSDLETLNGKRVAVMEKSVQGEQFSAWEQLHGVQTRHMDPVSGELTGVLCDYVAYAADCLSNQPLEFNLIGFDAQEEELQALKEGKIDVIFLVSQNPYEVERNGLALSGTAWTLQLAAVTAKEQFREGDANRVAVGEGGLAAQWFLSQWQSPSI